MKLREIVVSQLGVKPEEVTPQSNFIDDLKADSLEMVDLIIAVEEEFGITVADEEAEQIKTFVDAIKMIQKKVSQGEA